MHVHVHASAITFMSVNEFLDVSIVRGTTDDDNYFPILCKNTCSHNFYQLMV